MNVGELKELLKDIPNDVTVCIEDLELFNIQDFEVGVYSSENKYINFILPIYIGNYIKNGEDEEVILH